MFPLTSVYSQSEASMSAYVLGGVSVFAGRWWVTQSSVHTDSALNRDTAVALNVFPPNSSYLFLGFLLKYPEPHLSFPALQVFVCLLIGLRGAPPLPKSNWVARIQTMRRNFGTSVNLWRASTNAGKHGSVCNKTVQYIKPASITRRVWTCFNVTPEGSALSPGGASLDSLKPKSNGSTVLSVTYRLYIPRSEWPGF